ncbi:hypothetical protein JAAARDRAFT_364719 [Jaapia argillacea MUCL 33604]|uniref:Transmembrane protein n=1 Tax=Jaapia argillacea MUCL 33604 TaxID=933084 RepID=A0A067Q7W3_9AGAM|nr:hypothetical protein JAAARDRAFT_364719 [Jaapia argillacea MUCL 33604]
MATRNPVDDPTPQSQDSPSEDPAATSPEFTCSNIGTHQYSSATLTFEAEDGTDPSAPSDPGISGIPILSLYIGTHPSTSPAGLTFEAVDGTDPSATASGQGVSNMSLLSPYAGTHPPTSSDGLTFEAEDGTDPSAAASGQGASSITLLSPHAGTQPSTSPARLTSEAEDGTPSVADGQGVSNIPILSPYTGTHPSTSAAGLTLDAEGETDPSPASGQGASKIRILSHLFTLRRCHLKRRMIQMFTSALVWSIIIILIIGFRVIKPSMPTAIDIPTSSDGPLGSSYPWDGGIILLGHLARVDMPTGTFWIDWMVGACGKDLIGHSMAPMLAPQCGSVKQHVQIFVDLSPVPAIDLQPELAAFYLWWENTTQPMLQLSPPYFFRSSHVIKDYEIYSAADKSRTAWYPVETWLMNIVLSARDNSTGLPIPILWMDVLGSVTGFAIRAWGVRVRRDLPQSAINSTAPPSNVTFPDLMQRLDIILLRSTSVKNMAWAMLAGEWVLTFAVLIVTIFYMFRVMRGGDIKPEFLLFPFTALVSIPVLRDCMPDSPPAGSYIHMAGFFPCMIITLVCFAVLILLAVYRDRYTGPPHGLVELRPIKDVES